MEVLERVKKKPGRKPGTRNASIRKPAYVKVIRAPLIVNGMTDGSLVRFTISQEVANAYFQGKVNIAETFKIGKVIGARHSASGEPECTLFRLNGSMIAFVQLRYLTLEDR